MALFTGGLFVFTIALAIATIRLFQITKKGIENQDSITRDAFEHSKGSTERQLQAYISFRDVHSTPIVDQTIENRLAGWAFGGEWQNVGQTPAINVECAIYTSLSIKGETVIFKGGAIVESIKVKLGPSMKFSSAFNAVSTATLQSTIKGEKNVYVLFKVTYETTFSAETKSEEICIRIKCVRTDFLLSSDLSEQKRFFHFEAHSTYVVHDAGGQKGTQNEFITLL